MGLGALWKADAWVFGWLFWGVLFWFEEEGFVCFAFGFLFFGFFSLLDSILYTHNASNIT